MTNSQLWIAIGVPTFAVLVGILLNQLGQSRLENRLNIIESDLRRFWQILGEHGARLDAVERK